MSHSCNRPRRRGCLRFAVVLLAVLVYQRTALPATIAQDPRQREARVSLADFGTASPSEKARILGTLSTGERVASEDAPRILEAGLGDRDSSVRKVALDVVTYFAWPPPSFGPQRGPVAEPLRLTRDTEILVPRLLDDPEAAVRRAAIIAGGRLKSTRRPTGDVLLDVGFMRRLVAMYDSDNAPEVRVEIVKTLALVADRRPDVPSDRVILEALGELEPEVVQYACIGVRQLKLKQGLPGVVPHLRSEHVGIRMAAATAIGSFGMDAARYAPELQLAASIESDEPTRQTMLGALRAIGKL